MMAASAAVSLIFMLYTGQDPPKQLDVQTWQAIEQSITPPETPDPLNSVQSP
jgi:hypothetical protein